MYKRLTNDEYIQKVEQWQVSTSVAEKNILATEILQSMSYLIRKAINRRTVSRTQETKEDVYAELSIIVLTRVLPKFNRSKSKGAKFITYAMHWVMGYITRVLDKVDNLVFRPVNGRQLAWKEQRETGKVSDKLAKYLTPMVYWDSPKKGSTNTIKDSIIKSWATDFEETAIQAIDDKNNLKLVNTYIDTVGTKRNATIVRRICAGETRNEIAVDLGITSWGVSLAYKAHINLIQAAISSNHKRVTHYDKKRT